MKRHITALLAAAIAALASCTGRGHHSALTSLDSLTEAAPEAAAARLDSLAPAMATAQQADRMHFELLRLKAACLTYNPPQSDSTALAIVNYYKNAPGTGRLAEACYYTGKVYLALRDYPEAMNFFHMALDNAPEPATRLKARTYAQLGYIFMYQWLNKDAIKMFTTAYKHYKAANDTSGMIYCLRDLGYLQKNAMKYDKAIRLYGSALSLAKSQNNEDLAATVSGQLASLYCTTGNLGKAWEHLKKAIAYNDPYDQGSILHITAELYEATGMQDSAISCYQKLIKTGDIYSRKDAYRKISEYYGKKNDVKQEIKYFNVYEILTDSIQSSRAAEAIKQASNKYNYSLREKENRELEAENSKYLLTITILICVIIVLSMAIVLIIALVKNKHINQKYKQAKYLNPGKDEKSSNAGSNDKDLVLKQTEIYLTIIRRLNEHDSKKRLTEDEWKQLSEKVNETYPNFKAKVYELCKMSIADYRLCLLIKIGISPSAMAQILSKTSSGITSARSKLYKRAFGRNGGAADWDAVILSL